MDGSTTTVRIERKPSFGVIGKSVWISGQDNEQFGAFWSEAHKSGLVSRLKALSNGGRATNADIFGVSCVERDPDNRAFYFLIAAEGELTEELRKEGLEGRVIPECEWAIFGNRGELPMSLVNAEMYAFCEWLPKSGYRHALAPELEVYPRDDGGAVEFWLPITESK